MTEIALIEQLQTSRYNIGFFVSLVFTSLFAITVATHYFLRAEKWPVKVSVLSVFSMVYAALLLLYQWEIVHVGLIVSNLRDMSEAGSLSPGTDRLLVWFDGVGSVQTWLPWLIFAAAWLLVAAYLFVPDKR